PAAGPRRGPPPAQPPPGGARPARRRRRAHHPVEPAALHLPGQAGVQDTPADLPRGEARQARRQPERASPRWGHPAEQAQGAAAASGGHAGLAPAVAPAAATPGAAAGRLGLARDLAGSKRRTRDRDRKVWSGQLLVLRPEAVVYQLRQPLSHTVARLVALTHALNERCTSGRTSIQSRPSSSSARRALAT